MAAPAGTGNPSELQVFINWEFGNSLSQNTLVHPKNWVSPFILCTLSILRSLGVHSLTAFFSFW
jgi:hypothetical protein